MVLEHLDFKVTVYIEIAVYKFIFIVVKFLPPILPIELISHG